MLNPKEAKQFLSDAIIADVNSDTVEVVYNIKKVFDLLSDVEQIGVREELDKIEKDVATLPYQRATTAGGQSKIRSSQIKWVPQNNEWFWLYEKLSDLFVHLLVCFCIPGYFSISKY